MPMDQKQIVKLLFEERPFLFAYILSLVRQREMAEDVFQDVCLLALEKHQDIHDREHLLAWVRASARFYAKNALRKHGREKIPLTDSILDALEVDWRAQSLSPTGPLMEALQVCIDRLNAGTKQMLKWRYVNGLEMQDIAQRLNRSINSIYVTVSRAYSALFECVNRRVAAEKRVRHD